MGVFSEPGRTRARHEAVSNGRSSALPDLLLLLAVRDARQNSADRTCMGEQRRRAGLRPCRAAWFHAIARLRFIACGYRRRVRAYARRLPRTWRCCLIVFRYHKGGRSGNTVPTTRLRERAWQSCSVESSSRHASSGTGAIRPKRIRVVVGDKRLPTAAAAIATDVRSALRSPRPQQRNATHSPVGDLSRRS